MTPRPLILPQQYQWWGLVPAFAGLFALSLVDGIFSALLAGPPAMLWLVTGLSLILLPGDARVTAYMALSSVFGLLVSIPLMFMAGFGSGFLLTALALASFVVAGRMSLTQTLNPDTVPMPSEDLGMQVKVGFDEAMMGYFLISARVPGGERAARMCDQAIELGRVLEDRGWLEHPHTMHLAPPAPEAVNTEPARCFGFDYQRLSFDSGYVPDPALPGAAEWAARGANRRAAGWMLRHPGPARPWLVCVHGYRMGEPWVDFQLFKPGLLHQRLGLNVLMPILPLHGPRRAGRQSGDLYLDGDLLDLLFAQTQALWDLRRWLAWLRDSQAELFEGTAPQIGVYGISLGGYNTALLTGYESKLDFGVAVIPVMEFAQTLWRVMPPPHRRYFEARGLSEARYRELLTPVSPLSRPTLLARDRRFVVAANADRIVPVAQPTLLAQHWDVEPRWYAGSHMSIGREAEPRLALEEAMRCAGWDARPL
ncbi:MAG: alpha/beta hydrolase family protein [Panacagrimonas sp.]